LRKQIKPTLDVGARLPKWKHFDIKTIELTPLKRTTKNNRYLTMDGRTKDNPRNGLLSFRADTQTIQKVKDEAKKKGISISQHLSEKLSK